MESTSKKVMGDVNSDFISNLPGNVKDEILVRLPIQDAVRTSVLSTKWRYKWTDMPELVFHDNYALPYPYNNKDKLIGSIDRVLLLHDGLFHKFELETSCLPPMSSIIDGWILFLSRKKIKEFVLKFSYRGGERYKLPTCFFSTQQISTLELHQCVLKPPPTFTGFGLLKSLYLKHITLDSDVSECLISKSPFLERLTLEMFYGLDHLNISSPNLKYLCLLGSFEDICFENTPQLSEVSIGLTNVMTDQSYEKFLKNETCNAVKVLSALPSLRKFVVQYYFLEFLTVRKSLGPFMCHHLNSLYLHLNCEDVDEIYLALCLLKRSPNLQELEIYFCSDPKTGGGMEDFLKIVNTHHHLCMNELLAVKMGYFRGLELELELIKFLLATSPLLEMLSIKSYRNGQELLKELLRFPRASPKAVIEFLEPTINEDVFSELSPWTGKGGHMSL